MALKESLNNKIAEAKIISFDVFDTLLLRPYAKPTDVFFHMEHLFKIKGFRDARVAAEQQARKTHQDREDITLDMIYNELGEQYKSLQAKELEMESKILRANPEIKEVYAYAKQQNKKIIITSDMYLPTDFVNDVLIREGYGGYDKIYISGDMNKTKATGSLYDYIIAEYKCEPQDILHIGDNQQSDYDMALKKKLHAYHYKKLIDRYLDKNIRARQFYYTYGDDLGVSILLATTAVSLIYDKKYWQDFGFKYGGPAVYAFVKWLDEQFKKDNITEAMFVARDGYVLSQVYDIIKTKEVNAHYFYAPRLTYPLCSLDYQNYNGNDKDKFFNILKSILAHFKEKDDYLAANTPDIKDCAEGVAFIDAHKELYQKLADKERENYRQYLSQFEIKSKDIALIDSVSESLSAQKALTVALSEKHISGYYYWFGEHLKTAKYPTTSYITSSMLEFVDWNIMELFMTAPTPPADKIINGHVVFKEINEEEARRIEIYPSLAEGIVEYAKLMQNIFGDMPTFITSKNVIEWINVLCAVPTDLDKKEFSTIKHAEDANHSTYINLPQPWFDNAALTWDKYITNTYRFFGIPLLKRYYRWGILRYKLFNIIHLLDIKIKQNKRNVYLCKFIPLGKVTYKQSEKYFSADFYLFGKIKFLSARRKLRNMSNCGIYLFNLRLFTIKRTEM